MIGRLAILKKHNLKLKDIQEVIETLAPLDGAYDFLQWLKSEFQVIILSDTFYEFAQPLMKKLDYPTLFCHKLITDDAGNIISYKLRQNDQKTKAVAAPKALTSRLYPQEILIMIQGCFNRLIQGYCSVLQNELSRSFRSFQLHEIMMNLGWHLQKLKRI